MRRTTPNLHFYHCRMFLMIQIYIFYILLSMILILPFSLSYKLIQQQPSMQSYNSYWYVYLIIIFILLSILIYLFITKTKRYKPKNSKVVHRNQFVSILSNDERRVLDIIRRRGKIYQHELVDITSFSKAKVSKIINKLINYKLVKKKQIGKFNELKPNR